MFALTNVQNNYKHRIIFKKIEFSNFTSSNVAIYPQQFIPLLTSHLHINPKLFYIDEISSTTDLSASESL